MQLTKILYPPRRMNYKNISVTVKHAKGKYCEVGRALEFDTHSQNRAVSNGVLNAIRVYFRAVIVLKNAPLFLDRLQEQKQL